MTPHTPDDEKGGETMTDHGSAAYVVEEHDGLICLKVADLVELRLTPQQARGLAYCLLNPTPKPEGQAG